MEELNDMLAELASEGAVDSSGEFMLALDKALEKLSAYQLANPALFILNLVAAAVTGGATYLKVETRENETTFGFDPKAGYDDEQLERLFAAIMNPSAPAHLRELALAVHGARALPGSPRIVLWIGHHTMAISGESIVFEETSACLMGARLTLSYPERGMWSRLVNPTDQRGSNVIESLFHYCRFAPLSLLYNGQSKGAALTLGVYDDSVFAHRGLRGTQAMKMVAVERRHGLFLSAKSQSPVASSMAISLGTPEAVKTHGFVLISRGVAFSRPVARLLFPLATVVVSADHLEKNLSQSDLVEDDAYHDLIEAVRAEIDDLVLEVCLDPPAGWSTLTAMHFGDALAARYPSTGPVPIQVQAFHRSTAMKQLCGTAAGRQEQLAFWRDLRQKDERAAGKFTKSLGRALEKLTQDNLALATWAEALDCLVCLYRLKEKGPDAFSVVLMLLAGQDETARAYYKPGMEEYSPALAHLMGWLDTFEGGGTFAHFARFERAFALGDLTLADQLAAELEQRPGNLMLPLWLGWYAHFRGRGNQAANLWEQSLSALSNRRRQKVAGVLWSQLRGKTSFMTQLGWHVRRRKEELEMAIGHSGDTSSASDDLSSWAAEVWKLRLDSQLTRAAQVFRTGLLSSLLHGQSLKLLPETFLGARLVVSPHERSV